MSAARMVGLVAGLLAAGCGGAAPGHAATGVPHDAPTDPAWVESGRHEALEPGHLESVGVEADIPAARALARRRLHESVYGDEAQSAAMAPAEVHREGVDPAFEARLSDGRVAVLLAVPRERIEEAFAELEAAQPAGTVTTASIAETLQALHRLIRQRFTCERRRALWADACEPPDLGPTLGKLRTFAESLRLVTDHRDGLPLDASGRPVAPFQVRVARHDAGSQTPVAGLPLRVAGEGMAELFTEPSALTDAEGRARFVLRPEVAFPAGVQVELDAARLYGALAAQLPGAHVAVRSRALAPTRAALFIHERALGAPTSDGRVAPGARRLLGRHTGAVVRVVDEAAGRALLAATGEARSAAIRALAEGFEGRVDVVVLGEADAEFASRMGGHSVWYEARLRGAVYDLWTGRRLTELELTATASGLGDARADQAARAALAEPLVEQLLQVLRPAPEPSASDLALDVQPRAAR